MESFRLTKTDLLAVITWLRTVIILSTEFQADIDYLTLAVSADLKEPLFCQNNFSHLQLFEISRRISNAKDRVISEFVTAY